MSSENVLWNTIQNAFISTIISTAISLFVLKFFVERSRKLRDHSVTLNNKSLKKWFEKIDEILKLDTHGISTQYSHKDHKIVPVELGNLIIIDHYQALEEHMKSGYPKEWKLWNELHNEVIKYNQQRSTALEDIRQRFFRDAQDLEFTEFYPQSYKSQPENFVNPAKVAELILKEVEQRLTGADKWWGGEPTIDFFMKGDTKIYRLTTFSSGDLINDIDISKVEFCKNFILSVVENPEIIKGAENLSQIDDKIKKKRDKFEYELKKLISYIELGNNLRGKCDGCSIL